jgi:putative hydrolase of the HAD superfamily
MTHAKIKHVSLDVWGTLIRSNPIFSKARNDYLIATYLNPNTPFIFKRVKARLDQQAEQYGIGLSHHQAYSVLHEALKCKFTPRDVTPDDVYQNVSQLFSEHPPEVIESAQVALNRLCWSDQGGYTVNISSNTNFIPGELMAKWLMRTFPAAIDFCVFSDELQVSKPSPSFFDTVMFGVQTMIDYDIRKEEILHIGDSTVCDVFGAGSYGFSVAQVDNIWTIDDVVTQLFSMNGEVPIQRKDEVDHTQPSPIYNMKLWME